jgi:hypothetical protein
MTLLTDTTPDPGALVADALAIGRYLSRRRPHLHHDFQPIASNVVELVDRLKAGEPAERIQPMLWNQLRWWRKRKPKSANIA